MVYLFYYVFILYYIVVLINLGFMYVIMLIMIGIFFDYDLWVVSFLRVINNVINFLWYGVIK